MFCNLAGQVSRWNDNGLGEISLSSYNLFFLGRIPITLMVVKSIFETDFSTPPIRMVSVTAKNDTHFIRRKQNLIKGKTECQRPEREGKK